MNNLNFSDWLALGSALLSLLLSIIAIWKAHNANKIAESGNQIAIEANQIAKEANELSKQNAFEDKEDRAKRLKDSVIICSTGSIQSNGKFTPIFEVRNLGTEPVKLKMVAIKIMVDGAIVDEKLLANKEDVIGYREPENSRREGAEFDMPCATAGKRLPNGSLNAKLYIEFYNPYTDRFEELDGPN